MSNKRIHSRPRTRQHGAVAVAFILMIVLLLGFVGLAVDAGRLFVNKTELQNAADACALSAAAALTGGSSNQLVQAESWGIATGTRNLTGFQDSAVLIPEDSAVTFSETLDGVYQNRTAIAGADAAKMRYARCTVAQTGIKPLLIQVLNLLPGTAIGDQEVRALATASNKPAQVSCAIPLGICKKPGSTAAPWGMSKGEWIEGRWEPGSGTSGNFKWLKFEFASTVPDMDELLKGSGQCALSAGANINDELPTKPGFINSLRDGYNSRFGLYSGSASATSWQPDFSGYSYWWEPATGTGNWNPAVDGGAYDDFTSRRGSFAPVQSDFNKAGWKGSTSAQHQSLGGDRRLATMPLIDCDELDSSHKTTVLDWACIFLLHPINNSGNWPIDKTMLLEYRGLATAFDSGCVTSGLPGGPGSGGPRVPALVQ